MSSYVDLHCHWIWEIDDGARSLTEAVEMLRGLANLGFGHVVATPHIRPSLFDNKPADILARYAKVCAELQGTTGLPPVSLAAEHFFTPSVLDLIGQETCLPYARHGSDESSHPKQTLLLEFADVPPRPVLERALYRLRSQGVVPVIAHPERYPAVWADRKCLQPLLDLGCAPLLDCCAVVGKYGEAPRRAALKLLEEGTYAAACSDAHRPADIPLTGEALHFLEREFGRGEVQRLFSTGPRSLVGVARPHRFSPGPPSRPGEPEN